jgi:hypothetical protein
LTDKREGGLGGERDIKAKKERERWIEKERYIYMKTER